MIGFAGLLVLIFPTSPLCHWLDKKRIVAHGFAQKYARVPIPREYCIVLHRFQGMLIIFNMFFPDKATWFLLCLCSCQLFGAKFWQNPWIWGYFFLPIFRSPYWNKTHYYMFYHGNHGFFCQKSQEVTYIPPSKSYMGSYVWLCGKSPGTPVNIKTKNWEMNVSGYSFPGKSCGRFWGTPQFCMLVFNPH
jgi:hypothetical protein